MEVKQYFTKYLIIALNSFQIGLYTKMDIWMVTCVIFVFTTLLELVAALVYKNWHNNDQNTNTSSPQAWERNTTNSSKPETNVPTSDDIGKKLAFAEKCFVAIYFSFFTVFCLQYWFTFYV